MMKNNFIWRPILVGMIVALLMLWKFPLVTLSYIIVGFLLYQLVEYLLISEDSKITIPDSIVELSITERCLYLTLCGMWPITLFLCGLPKLIISLVAYAKKKTK